MITSKPLPFAAAVAAATVRAAERRLVRLRGDPSLAHCFWLLVRLAEAARGPDFLAGVRALGVPIQRDDTALALAVRVADAARSELDRHPESGPFGELASLALRRALTETVGVEGRSLFGSSLEDLERAFRRHSSDRQFGDLARRFFGDFMARTLRFYVDRELPQAVGRGGLPTVGASSDFAAALDLHARQTARAVELFAVGWYGKKNWETLGAIGREDAEGFVAHALPKLRAALVRGAAR
jgi:hypothetical protein